MSVFYHIAPLRSRTMETMEQISHSVHTSFVDTTTPRSQRSTLDIVIIMYKEDAFEIATQLQELLALDPVRKVEEVNTIIYAKDPETDPEVIKADTNATDVVHLANLGREA